MVEEIGGVAFEYRYAQEKVPDDVCSMFHLFCRRFEQLNANMADLRGRKSLFSMNFTKDQGRVTASGQSQYNPHRLKGLFLDYRPFAAQRDITHFPKVCNKVTKYFPDPIVIRMIENARTSWSEDHLSRWHGRAFDEIVDTFFNAALFHTDVEKQADLIELTSAFDDVALQSTIFFGVDQRMAAIRNVAFIIGACSIDQHAVRVPLSETVK